MKEISEYSICKTSIGLKLFLKTKEDFNIIQSSLNNNIEYFTYATKSEKPYKALLFGLDKMDPNIIQNKLNNIGLKCLNIKPIEKKTNHFTQIFYIVYFERQSITLKELRQNYSVLEHIKIRWEYQRRNSSKITQCYNCQMFGHGSNHCKVKSFCAICSGKHHTSECKSTIVKCANCKGTHKSFSKDCPIRHEYIKLKEKLRKPLKKSSNNKQLTYQNYNTNFPNTLNQNLQQPNTWLNQNNNLQNQSSYNNMFTIQEMKELTLDLISKLQNCKSKSDQFEVITTLAFKFLT